MILAFIVTLLLGLGLGRGLIPFLRQLKFGQEIREDGPQSHQKKQGTPTMGGVLFILLAPIGMWVAGAFSKEGVFLLMTALFFGFIGLLDDGLIIAFKRSEGLTPKQKLFLQVGAALIVVLWAIYGVGLEPSFALPLTDLRLGKILLYLPLMVFIIVGSVNACNLTDGLDGLLSTVTIVVLAGFLAIALWQKQAQTAAFIVVFMAMLLSFLVYNWHPAKVFMGDTGSFFIGGAVVGIAMITSTELLLPLFGLVYVLETLSDIIQIFVFKRTGRRVFKMAPLHHHFELLNYREVQVVMLFALMALGGVLAGLLIYNLSPIYF